MSEILPDKPDDKEPPHRLPDGKYNWDWARWAYRQITHLTMQVAVGNLEMPKGYNLDQARKVIDAEVQVNGGDPKYVADVRSDAQIMADSVDRLLTDPANAIFEADIDPIIRLLDERFDAADAMLMEEFGTSSARGSGERLAAKLLGIGEKEPDDRKSWWRRRLQRVSRLRERARDPFPKGYNKTDFKAVEAAHPLRYMLYVGRKGGTGEVFWCAEHHAKMARETYTAEKGLHFVEEEKKFYNEPCEGIMLVLPPGHGKTAFFAHLIALRYCQNSKLRGLFGHAQENKASENLEYVTSMLDPKQAAGRRTRALFPSLPEIEQASTKKMRFALNDRQRQPTISAHGMTGRISGGDADFIWFDDACDQSIAEQDTERKRVFDRMNGTWRTRKRGKTAFEYISTTLWHQDDPHSRLIALVEARKVKFAVLILSCGGPESSPPFKPLFPEEIPASKLKQEYARLGPRLYAACFQSNPQPEELRKIKRLAYYLPGEGEHRRFLSTCLFHISLDPSATNKEKSDKASFVYAGVGDIVTEREGCRVFERRMRILDARQFLANQTEGVDVVCGYAELHSTHYIHAETRSGFNATAEMLEAKGLDVIRHDPKNTKKLLRLEHVAVMLDDSLRSKGFSGAVVEFPGKRVILEDGTEIVGADTESEIWFVMDQILNAGVCREDHALDAVTQLCKHVGPELGVGDGAATVIIQQGRREGVDPRMERELGQYAGSRGERSAASEDHEFFVRDN